MKVSRLFLAMAAIVARLFVGCASPNTSGVTVGVAVDEDGNTQEVLQTDNPRLSRQLVVGDVVVGQTKNGLMRVNLTITSKLNKDIVAQSKFAWFDAEGAEIDPDSDA